MNYSTSFFLVVELTNRCNFSCIHCFRTNNIASQPDLPIEVYEKFLQEAHLYQNPHISLTGGGEPTLHQEFETILAMTARHGYTYTLVTNGWTFERIYPLLLKYRNTLYTVAFSLDGATEATHDGIRQQPGSYQRVLQACMICYYKQIPFRLTMTLHRRNVQEIDQFFELAATVGADEVNIGSAQLTPQLVSQHLALSPQERRRIESRLTGLDDDATPIPVNLGFDFFIRNPCFPCKPLQTSTLVLDYTGHIRFCCQLTGYHTKQEHTADDILGDLRDTPLWECHRAFVQKIAAFQDEKIRRLAQNALTDHDYFPCFYCAKYFHKLDWLAEFPDSEWMTDEQ